jgi:hypothetical protein
MVKVLLQSLDYRRCLPSEYTYWRKSVFIGEVHRFIGEKMILLAKFTTLLAKSCFYWRTGKNHGFFPAVRQQSLPVKLVKA